MFLKKDNFLMGLIIGLVAPVIGLLIFKEVKFKVFSLKEMFQFMYMEPGFKTLTAALSVSLLANALFFTIYINSRKDKTAKGIFVTTLLYGLLVLSVKTFA